MNKPKHHLNAGHKRGLFKCAIDLKAETIIAMVDLFLLCVFLCFQLIFFTHCHGNRIYLKALFRIWNEFNLIV